MKPSATQAVVIPRSSIGERRGHPLATGLGAAAGGLAGAIIGFAGGPICSIVGAAIGAVAGGYAGKGVAEEIDRAAAEERAYDNYAAAFRARNDHAMRGP